MRTDILSPSQIFQNIIRYVIPIFQRQYVWTKDDQWESLWEDVRNIAENYLNALDSSGNDELQAEKNTPTHFLGAIVVQQVPAAVTAIGSREIIDGQQRMTTLQLLLDAIQIVCEELDLKPSARRLARLVTNDEDFVRNDDEVFKLWPTMRDQEAFRHAMHNGLATDGFEDSLIVQAHDYFRDQAKDWLEEDRDDMQRRIQALETAVTGLLQMVVIDLSTEDNPHVIFETLNARGTPLLESDLIKNYVMSRVDDQSEQSKIWGDLDNDWWRAEVTQGRLRRPRVEMLLNYWLAMRTASEVNASRVFNVFMSHARNRSIHDVMSDVRHDLGNYLKFDTDDRTEYEEIFHYRVIRTMGIGSITPALLLLLSAEPKAREKALEALESFLIRRMVCSGNSKDYNRLTFDLVRELRKQGTDKADRVVVDFLRNQTAYSREWPNNSAVEYALVNRTLYRVLTQGRLRLLLEGIEEKLIEKSMAAQRNAPENTSIEHVMPQSWEANWPLPDGVEKQDATTNRNRLIHTIGNLTLVNSRLNPKLSNDSWENKRKKLRDNDNLFLNKRLLDESRDTAWDEDFIEARSRRMAKLVAEVWPGPESSVWDE